MPSVKSTRVIVEFLERVGEDSLLSLCLSVHMSSTGGADPWSERGLEDALKVLLLVLRDWEERSNLFDDAVKNLVMATVIEAQTSMIAD